MQKEKVRVYALARELNMESKDLLDLCKDAGLDLKNQLSSLDPEQRDMIEALVKGGGPAKPAAQVTPAVSQPVVPQNFKKNLPDLTSKPKLATTAGKKPSSAEVKPETETPEPIPSSAEVAETPPESGSATTENTDVVENVEVPAAETKDVPESSAIPEVEAETSPKDQGTTGASEEKTDSATKPTTPPVTPSKAPVIPSEKKIRDLNSPRQDRDSRDRKMAPRPSAGRPTTPPPAKVAAPPPMSAKVMTGTKPDKKPKDKTQKPLMRLTPEMLEKARNQVIRPEDVFKNQQPAPVIDLDDDDSDDGKGKKDGKRKDKDKDKGKKQVGLTEREQRKKQREERKRQREKTRELVGVGTGVDEDERPGRRSSRTRVKRQSTVTAPRQGKIPIEMPITVRALSEAIGIKSVPLLLKLQSLGMPRGVNLNTTIEPDIAEEVAFENGCELEIKRSVDLEDNLLAEFDRADNPEDLRPRAPIVTIMGHVDHGKTSLLDKIRQTNVVDTEAGGITQVIRAWRVEHDGKPITFLDTPGHEAFTKMRARGAQVTDIAVIVVAADDGVMPQTEEAIAHAKAAGVSLVIAINKIDVPNANKEKARQQLYSLSVLPDDMGGDTPFVETSAATGKGIDELLENISIVAELKELTANPDKRAKGVCLEAMLSEGEGVLATLLVREGTLRRGDVVLCGASYGRIRQLYNDLGKPIDSAGPSVPVRIMGLDEVPNADDPFVVVGDLAKARQIAEQRKERRQEQSFAPRAVLDLSKWTAGETSEIKVILKADFRGSIEAIRKELEKLQHDEVTVRLLHAGIGGISESDVQLALTSPEDTFIVGFNAVPDDRALDLAEEKGITIREYNVIYMLTEDIRAALEGKLKPRQEVVHLGRAVVRDTFKISRVGTIAGCYVTQGIIQRSSKVRLIRDGVIVYPPADKTAGLESLKRFKDDTGEVREGFECGIKIAGYDDVKVGDVIEAYRVDEVQRTLD